MTQRAAAERTRDAYQAELTRAGYGADHHRDRPGRATFFYAEDYHQQYLAQESQGLLPRPRHRHRLPGRAGSTGGVAGPPALSQVWWQARRAKLHDLRLLQPVVALWLHPASGR